MKVLPVISEYAHNILMSDTEYKKEEKRKVKTDAAGNVIEDETEVKEESKSD